MSHNPYLLAETGVIYGSNKWDNDSMAATQTTYSYSGTLSVSFENALRHLLQHHQRNIHLAYFAKRAVIMLFGFDEAFVDTFRPDNSETVEPKENSINRTHAIRFWDTNSSHMFYVILSNQKIELRYCGPRPPPTNDKIRLLGNPGWRT